MTVDFEFEFEIRIARTQYTYGARHHVISLDRAGAPAHRDDFWPIVRRTCPLDKFIYP